MLEQFRPEPESRVRRTGCSNKVDCLWQISHNRERAVVGQGDRIRTTRGRGRNDDARSHEAQPSYPFRRRFVQPSSHCC
jgi:hypothetical protein